MVNLNLVLYLALVASRSFAWNTVSQDSWLDTLQKNDRTIVACEYQRSLIYAQYRLSENLVISVSSDPLLLMLGNKFPDCLP